jgi:hypothetical protein
MAAKNVESPVVACGAALRGIWGRCERPVTVTRDGKGYCWQHDPVRRKEESDAALEARKAVVAANEAKAKARYRHRELERCAGIVGLSDEDLEILASIGGVFPIIERAREAERSRQVRESGAPAPAPTPRPDPCDCCDRHDEYNGYASGPLLFVCPKSCSCHD